MHTNDSSLARPSLDSRAWLALAAVAFGSACTGSVIAPVDGAVHDDARAMDASGTPIDAATPPDDAGAIDATAPPDDANTPIDASTSSDAATVPVVAAATCSRADVQAALDAAHDGDIVLIPAGDCDWTDEYVTRSADITIRGAGISETILRRTAFVANGDDSMFMMQIECGSGATVELSGITFIGNDLLQSDAERRDDHDGGAEIHGHCVDLRVHHVRFERFSNAGLELDGIDQRGVVYESEFVSNYKCGPDSGYPCAGYGVAIYGDRGATPEPLVLGTEEAVFVEDSYFFDNRHGIASNYGSRYVARRNRIVGSARGTYGSVDAHGSQRAGYAGSMSWEVYENTFDVADDIGSTVPGEIRMRGGDGVIWGNEFTSEYVRAVLLREELYCASWPVPWAPTDVYVWDNTQEGAPFDVVDVDFRCTDYIVEDSEYHLIERVGYVPYTYPHPLRTP